MGQSQSSTDGPQEGRQGRRRRSSFHNTTGDNSLLAPDQSPPQRRRPSAPGRVSESLVGQALAAPPAEMTQPSPVPPVPVPVPVCRDTEGFHSNSNRTESSTSLDRAETEVAGQEQQATAAAIVAVSATPPRRGLGLIRAASARFSRAESSTIVDRAEAEVAGQEQQATAAATAADSTTPPRRGLGLIRAASARFSRAESSTIVDRAEADEEQQATAAATLAVSTTPMPARRGLGLIRAASARFGRSPSNDETENARRPSARRFRAMSLGRAGAAAAIEEPPHLISMEDHDNMDAGSDDDFELETDDGMDDVEDDSPLGAVSEEHPTTPTSVSRSMAAATTGPPVLRVARVGFEEPNSSPPEVTPAMDTSPGHYRDPHQTLYYRRGSTTSTYSGGSFDTDKDMEYNDEFSNLDNILDFFPPVSRNNEWMGRSIESLVLGHSMPAPILALSMDEPGDDRSLDGDDYDFYAFRRRSTCSTFGGGPESVRRRSSQGSFPGGRRGSLSLSSNSNMQGGTLATYYNRRQRQVPTDVDRTYGHERQGRRGSTAQGPVYRRRGSVATSTYDGDGNDETAPRIRAGPNVVLSIMARESTGKTCFRRELTAAQSLRKMGGACLYQMLDEPAGGIVTDVAFLAAAIEIGDWAEAQMIISRLAPRLIGDPSAAMQGIPGGQRSSIDDPSLPPTAPRFFAGGGRVGLERDAFVLAGGVQILIRIFREKSFVGQEMASSYDARDLSEELVATRLAPCWNEVLASFREMVYAMPSLVESGTISDNGDFLPFLFTLLSHDSCFDGAAALIEEILSLLSQSPQQPSPQQTHEVSDGPTYQPVGRVSPATTFFLGNVPNLYTLWGSFNCRQLAHFCRILALLVFEPEDRQLLESPAVLKSLELLQLRRNRAARAGRDSTVDMNQAILLGDVELLKRLLKLLTIMNYAPPLRRFSPYHVMSHFPFIADTLVMLGLSGLEDWDEVSRQEALSRNLLAGEDGDAVLHKLGAVADMLETLSTTLTGNPREPANQLGHIIHVLSAAQQAGVVVGGSSRRRSRSGGRDTSTQSTSRESSTDSNEEAAGAFLRMVDAPVDDASIQDLASLGGILTDQSLMRRLFPGAGPGLDGLNHSDAQEADPLSQLLIKTPEDAANSLQFNGLILGPYQVELLFVLSTLLGGRRKLDAQDILKEIGLVSVLEEMFPRFPWYDRQAQESETRHDSFTHPDSEQHQNGIHGPGCECTPESALYVQYLRLLHNFCDRDCDNYSGRRLLLSASERKLIFDEPDDHGPVLRPGLLSKIIEAFIHESDESPYRFWLASCIESYLRGSSPGEQVFAAQSGLLDHLAVDISSDRLHCAGSLQTSFDLLGELVKGNSNVVRLLVNDFDEESFRKLMSVAAANLVDSNVFIRSLLLSLERISAGERLTPLYLDAHFVSRHQSRWKSQSGTISRSYLTHSWWDAVPTSLVPELEDLEHPGESDECRHSDWFPTRSVIEASGMDTPSEIARALPTGLQESVGHFGWVFMPTGDTLSAETYQPNTVERLSWFLAANQAQLLRDLLGVVDLRNINHENICCLNTAVVITIFAHRRHQLSALLEELRHMNDIEKETKRRANHDANQDDVVDRAFVQAMKYMDLDQQREAYPYARRASLNNTSNHQPRESNGTEQQLQQIGDRSDVMRNFREVLWFWSEYYTHRGRDRLSLEFSSHLRFQEWQYVVSLLASDDESSTALVQSPVRLPRSPYQRATRIADNPLREF